MLTFTHPPMQRLLRNLLVLLGMVSITAPAAAATSVLINFDTPKDVTWQRRVKEGGVTVTKTFMKTTTASGLTAGQKASIMTAMSTRFMGTGVTFTTDSTVAHTKTLDLTGGTTPAAIGKKLFGTTALDDTAAWVFVGEFAGLMTHGDTPRALTDDEKAMAIAHTADHEVGHMLGLGHRWDQTLMAEGSKVSWETRITMALPLAAADKTQLESLTARDDHAAALLPGSTRGVRGLINLDGIPDGDPTHEDLYFAAEVSAGSELFEDLSGFNFGVLNAAGEFLMRGNLGNIDLGADKDVFSLGSGEAFDFALQAPGGEILSEHSGNLLGAQFLADVGGITSGVQFAFDTDTTDGFTGPDTFIGLTAEMLSPGSEFEAAFRDGDANGDGLVNFADFAILQNNFNMPGDVSMGDFNNDGQVTFADFAILQNNFDSGSPGSAPSLNPEPGSAALLALGGLGWLARRRRIV
jgi:hypothetical protein